jgi:hypothetical protein
MIFTQDLEEMGWNKGAIITQACHGKHCGFMSVTLCVRKFASVHPEFRPSRDDSNLQAQRWSVCARVLWRRGEVRGGTGVLRELDALFTYSQLAQGDVASQERRWFEERFG